MKPIDDEKINNINITLEERFKAERTDWNSKIIELVESIKHTSKLSEAQVIQLSYRQMIQDKLAEYRILHEKRQEMFDKQTTDRFREYKLSYDIKLSGTETQAFVQSDCKALKLQLKMIHTQIIYFEESIKTLDNIGYAIKNKIEIVSHQLI
jgi:hypothetical protein